MAHSGDYLSVVMVAHHRIRSCLSTNRRAAPAPKLHSRFSNAEKKKKDAITEGKKVRASSTHRIRIISGRNPSSAALDGSVRAEDGVEYSIVGVCWHKLWGWEHLSSKGECDCELLPSITNGGNGDYI